ncbi:MAG: radical SAM protein, partial [Candidatus Methanofastidiosia archaeon]
PLPTNCVAMDFCEARSKRGVNLAVFYEACSFNCLFCQNWNYKRRSNVMSSKELALKVNSDTYCICFFGGDPTPQLDHALKCSKLALEKRDLKICFETNGSSSLPLLKRMAKLSFNSGGTIKIDLKAYDEKLNLALCGVSNKNTLLNFEYLSKFSKERENFLVASTLLVPGYIDHIEVEKLAKFISNLNPEIPYCLLAFHPHFLMRDLERTSRRDAKKCFKIAKKYLMRVRIGNWWLLS